MTRKRGNLRWWLATVAGVIAVCVGLALGFWQLERAAQKTRLHDAMQAQSSTVTLDARAVHDQLALGDATLTHWLYRPIALHGQWMPAHTVYLDNRQMQGRPGFFVFTPLQLASGEVVLVQRGWIARNFQDRQLLQAIETPAGTVTVEGQLAGAPGRLYALGEGDAPDAHNPHIRQNLNLTAYAQTTGLPLWPVTVVQTGAASEGLLRAWPQPSSGIATHQGYAFQWFAIAAVLAAMVLWFQFLRPARTARQRHAAPKS
ncbi:SURF1 family protein [Comamonas sp. CMM02]|uniref:SURF1 family protein n=1 Tax=Comamonas sp. CMM02 TaxID=2769307 RepID=UPI0017820C8A|nr:SURF1 family protein [Comamonas sp. CMM02]MBD9400855.1 SURF1 family protein [Comamonas sp. CMM02]